MIEKEKQTRTHLLKIYPEHFARVSDGTKRFEVRVDDRGFHRGDIVVLREWLPVYKEYTGQERAFRVGFVLHGFGLKSDFCAFQLEELEPL